MNKNLFKVLTISILLGAVFNPSCQKLEPVSLTKFSPMEEVLSIGLNSATVKGKFMDVGESVISYGHCWSKNTSPTIEDDKSVNNGAPPKQVEFESNLTGLESNTKYYVRLYAVSGSETIYGDQISFTTNSSEELPAITTSKVSAITETTASGGGNVTSDGGSAVSARGICWSISENPTITDSISLDGTGVGTFISSMTDLTAGTTYYVRAYATNSVGTAYGVQESFITIASLPTVTTGTISAITQSTASSSGEVTSDGGAAITARGVCWSTTQSPTISDSKTTDGTGVGTFSSSITGLSASTTYYVRAYATNSSGTAYGAEVSFNTTAGAAIPTVTTSATSSITQTTASSGGEVTSDGGASVTARGVCWSTSQNPTISDSKTTDGTGTGIFTSSITGLSAGTTYYVRAYATNSTGTAYGAEVSFNTTAAAVIPTVSTTTGSSITQTTASSGGDVTSDGGASVTARGVCWSTSQNPTISDSKTTDGSGTGTFSSSISGLSASTLYYVRAYATNSVGTAYGNEINFTTSSGGSTVTDIDGNTYNTVTIGTQVWLKENLKTTKYSNGEAIGTTTPATLDISAESTPKYQWAYGGNEGNVPSYGRLYTWHAVADARNICPTGWHVPSKAELTTLYDYLTFNGYGYQGSGSDIAKSLSVTSGWTSDPTGGNVGNDQASNNSSGFSSVQSGYRDANGIFFKIGEHNYLWSTTVYDTDRSWFSYIYYNSANVTWSLNQKDFGFSVRCLKD